MSIRYLPLYVPQDVPVVVQTMPIISSAGVHSAIFHGLVITGCLVLVVLSVLG